MHPLIVDDHPIFRDALATAIRLAQPDAVLHEAARIAHELGVISRTQIVMETALVDFERIQVAPAG